MSQEQKPGSYPQSLIPGPGGSTLHIVTYPPDAVLQDHTLDIAAAVKEYADRLPGLNDRRGRSDEDDRPVVLKQRHRRLPPPDQRDYNLHAFLTNLLHEV